MPSLTAVAIIVLALLIATALFLMYEIGKLVGQKRAQDEFPEAKKAAVQRSRSVLGGMFAEQLAPHLPNLPFSPTEAKFIGAPIDILASAPSTTSPLDSRTPQQLAAPRIRCGVRKGSPHPPQFRICSGLNPAHKSGRRKPLI